MVAELNQWHGKKETRPGMPLLQDQPSKSNPQCCLLSVLLVVGCWCLLPRLFCWVSHPTPTDGNGPIQTEANPNAGLRGPDGP